MSNLPKWMKELKKGANCGKAYDALAIAWEALESTSKAPYKDSDLKSLLETINCFSTEAMRRIEELGK